jgi:hypothetical protein
LHPQRRHGAIDAPEGAEQAAATGPPPEGWLSHQGMIPKKPAPDLIQDVRRSSGKIMAFL